MMTGGLPKAREVDEVCNDFVTLLACLFVCLFVCFRNFIPKKTKALLLIVLLACLAPHHAFDSSTHGSSNINHKTYNNAEYNLRAIRMIMLMTVIP